jgi:hypothetical protein
MLGCGDAWKLRFWNRGQRLEDLEAGMTGRRLRYVGNVMRMNDGCETPIKFRSTQFPSPGTIHTSA